MIFYRILSIILFIILVGAIYIYQINKLGKTTPFPRINNFFINQPLKIKYFLLLSILFFTESLIKFSSDTYLTLCLAGVSLFLLFIFTIIYFWDTMHNDNIAVRKIGILFMYCFTFFLGISSFYTTIYSINNKWIFLITFSIFILVSSICLWCSFIVSNKILVRLVALTFVYLLIVLLGSWSFGAYYLINNLWPDKIINQFIASSSVKSLTLLSKYSLSGFYNFPENELLCIVSILQYYTGKFIDLFILGYIFDIVLKLKDDLQPN